MSDRPAIGKYEVLEQIGEGGFAAVYKARDPFIKRLVAIKLCIAADDNLRRRFFREAEISGNLHHPNIVTVFDFGLEDGSPYLVQEYLTGSDLDKLIRSGEPITEVQRLECLMQVAKGLRYAHSKGVLHRDIKPGNVRLLEDGKAKIMDFGIATLKSVHTRLTRVGTVVGTAGYLAPEQLRADELDDRVDVFSFGVLAYELLSNTRPFGGDSFEELCRNILEAEPVPLAEVAERCSEEMTRLVARCLEKSPADRYSGFGEILPELNAVLVQVRPDRRQADLKQQPEPQPREPAPTAPAADTAEPAAPRPRMAAPLWFRAVAGLAGLALVATLLWATLGRRSRPGVTRPLAIGTGVLVVDAVPWGEVVRIVDVAGAEQPLPRPAETPLALSLPAGGYRVEIAAPAADATRTCEVQVSAAGRGRCLVHFVELAPSDYFKQTGWWR